MCESNYFTKANAIYLLASDFLHLLAMKPLHMN